MDLVPGDILGVQGVGWLSEHIIEATAPGPLSHVGLIIAVQPALVIEALTRVRTRPLARSIEDAAHAWVLQPIGLSQEQRDRIVARACTMSADSYGYADIAWQGLDALFHTRWFTAHLARKLICSMLVADAYGMNFGVSERSANPNDIWRYAQAYPAHY